jgi:hypothetical protein
MSIIAGVSGRNDKEDEMPLATYWQLWVHKETKKPYLVGPTPRGLLLKHPVTREWVDAVLYYSGTEGGKPAHVQAYDDFRDKFEFIRQMEEKDMPRET